MNAFKSRDKDGGHTIRYENRTLYANKKVLCLIERETDEQARAKLLHASGSNMKYARHSHKRQLTCVVSLCAFSLLLYTAAQTLYTIECAQGITIIIALFACNKTTVLAVN